MTADIVRLPPPDPVFALSPELKRHLSEIDGALVVNSREVARVFNISHSRLLHKLAPQVEFYSSREITHWCQQCVDGSINLSPEGFLYAVGTLRPSKRIKQLISDIAEHLVLTQKRGSAQ